jgi:hypothetical protein
MHFLIQMGFVTRLRLKTIRSARGKVGMFVGVSVGMLVGLRVAMFVGRGFSHDI